MLLHKPVAHDSRVRREAQALLAAGFDVTVIELTRQETDGMSFDRIAVHPPDWVRSRLGVKAHRAWFGVQFVVRATRLRPAVVHAHDAAMLLPGALVALLSGAQLVYDSHEYATGVPYHEQHWGRFVGALERLIMPRCAAVITVSDGIADRLRSKYRLRRRPIVVRNVCSLPRNGAPFGLREHLNLTDEPLVLHQGAVAKDRGADVLLRAVAAMSGVHVCFLGAGSGADALVDEADAIGIGHRVHIVPSVPPDNLLHLTTDADVGVSLLQDTCDNHRLALPNKLFEYLRAGVPVVVSDLPEMRGVVDAHGVGWCVTPADADALAGALTEALGKRDCRHLRDRVARAAEHFTWTVEQQRLLGVYHGLGAPAVA